MKTAVVYIAGGSPYCVDAEVSRDSVKRNNPDLPCILATDETKNLPLGFDEIIQMPARRHRNDLWYLDSTRYYNVALDILHKKYDSLLFLDTDTYCDDNLSDMIRLSERFDISVTHGVSRHTTGKVSDIPDSFPEFEIGVMLVKTSATIMSLFKDWLDLYEAHPEVYGNNDQGPMRDALWLNQYVRMYVMAEEFHARVGFGVCVVSKVRILHSRSAGNSKTLTELAKEINSTGGRRLYWPEGNFWQPVTGQTKYKE